MNPVRGLLRDLVERRLWPVALLLVVAAVAVPVYLSRSSSDETGTPLPGPTAQAGPKISKAAVSLDDSQTSSSIPGSVRDPFKQRHQPKTQTTPSGDAPAANSGTTSTAGGTSSGSGSTGSGGAGSTGGGGSTGTKQPDNGGSTKTTTSGYHVTLHLGKVGSLKTYKDVARLSPLPSASNPLFVFTGVLKGGKRIVLLPSYGIALTPESDVQCKPSNTNCETIELEDDDTIFFTLLGDTTNTTYQLDVASISGKATSSTAIATSASLKRHSNAGAAMLRDAHVNGSSDYKGTSAYRWLPDAGVLVRTLEHSKARASANGAAAASSADVAASLPGLQVWHWQSGS